MKPRWLVALAALSFVLTGALHAPAALLYGWAGGNADGARVLLHGIHGTLSEGGVASLAVNQRALLSDLRWTLRPEWLALLQLTVDVETRGDPLLRARVSRTPFGALRVRDVDAVAGVRSLLGLAGQPALPLDGQVRVRLQRLHVDGGQLARAEGGVEIQGLAWALAREPVVLGNYTAALQTEENRGIVAVFADDGGPLELSGEARLAPDRSYDLHLQLRPRAQAGPSLVALVRSLNPPDAQGWYHLRRQGTL